MTIDLRSDTVTKPTPAMREAMAKADVGDDVYGEDPTVLALEARVAALLGKEAALFVTSGSMGNQLAIAVQTRPGDEVIVGEGAHPVFYEAGASPVLSGVQFAVAGTGGLYTAREMEDVVKPSAYYTPRTSLVCVENTHNRAGGRVFPQKDAIQIAERAHTLGFGVHLDGARLWNAATKSGLSESELAAPFDTISVCFSKGLGAPVGSAFVSTRENVERARRFRKMWGGGMRQAGIVAAGALYALEHHRVRLSEDHANAQRFAALVADAPSSGLRVDVGAVETNIVNVDTASPAEAIAKAARALGFLISASGPMRLRAVTHLDASREDVERAAKLLVRAATEAG
jgi:threonine aldolase